jgi:putative hydrolase of the HAD superfamily
VTSTSARSAASGGYEAVLFDALGTLVELEPPWPPLRAALAAHGIEVDEDEAKAAMLAEMAYYRAHHMEGADQGSLDELRTRCAAVLRDHLPPPAARLSTGELTEALLRALRFRPYPDAAPALGRLRQLGIRTAVVSNWDVSLKGVLAELGLGGLVDRAVVSAEAGVAKPAPAIFEHALRGLRCSPRRALFVGDSPETDVAGALGAGMRAVLVDRFGQAGDVPVGVERIATLASLEELVRPAFPFSP